MVLYLHQTIVLRVNGCSQHVAYVAYVAKKVNQDFLNLPVKLNMSAPCFDLPSNLSTMRKALPLLFPGGLYPDLERNPSQPNPDPKAGSWIRYKIFFYTDVCLCILYHE